MQSEAQADPVKVAPDKELRISVRRADRGHNPRTARRAHVVRHAFRELLIWIVSSPLALFLSHCKKRPTPTDSTRA